MNLHEFIEQSLTEILTGICGAQKTIGMANGQLGAINPIWNDTADLADHVQIVNFDVAVTASDQNSTGANGGIKVMALNFGGKVENQELNQTVSRVSFAVPIVPPTVTIHGVKKPKASQG